MSADTPGVAPVGRKLAFVDSHTGGEPTRVVLSGGPDLGTGSLADRLSRLRTNHDDFRSTVVNEPRGSDVLVGALLCEPVDPAAVAGVIFFNNVGYLGMCGHGTIGLVATLAHLGRLQPGRHVLETPVGDVTAELWADGSVSVHNVPSYRLTKGAAVTVAWEGEEHIVTGDVAWGGNWFFLCTDDVATFRLAVAKHDLERLTEFAWRTKQALTAAGITGAGAEIDHVELFSAGRATPGRTGVAQPGTGAERQAADSRSFVLCPGKAYDRSPCGTGTSAKLACLADDGLLAPGAIWVQESVIGSRFEAHYSLGEDGRVLPVITGTAHLTAQGELLVTHGDPFATGIL
ncbi:MAG TPA: proline racemase family protein [Trueperaceae bacterium]|nr:proline racemase family protein [Trueperaceae bacterium]